jgi:hypothetical protein
VRVALCYVCPTILLDTYVPLAIRFARSYMDFPPGAFPHDLHVVTNGPPPSPRLKGVFRPLPVTFHEHNNFAKDLGAYQLVAHTVDCDLLLCLGSHIHFPRGGWLDRLMDVYLQLGPGLYGCWGFDAPAPHIRTTCFFCPPALIRTYPHLTDDGRYEFEHGREKSILKWAITNGLPAVMVTWRRVGIYPDFFHVPSGENLLLDQHCDRANIR